MEVWEIFKQHDCPPVIIAGDVFDRWNTPVECVNKVIGIFGNFVINGKPMIYAIPGQHDLPNHRWEERHRSAYFTLVQAGVMLDIYKIATIKTRQGIKLTLHPFWWEKEITPLDKADGATINLAICHAFIWRPGYGYPGADESKLVVRYEKILKGYDAAVFGDNHKGFLHKNIFNCGTFYRRKADEIEYQPAIGLLMSDKTIKAHKLDVSKDKFLHREEDKKVDFDREEFSDLMSELRGLGPDSLDFRQTINRFMDDQKTAPAVREMVLEALG